jgi:hypothetical protein
MVLIIIGIIFGFVVIVSGVLLWMSDDADNNEEEYNTHMYGL